MNRVQKLMFRWAMVFAAIIALFWTIWWLTKGQVPSISTISFKPHSEVFRFQLPFAISRWWDVLAGPVWLATIIFFSEKGPADPDFENAKETLRWFSNFWWLASFVFSEFLIGLPFYDNGFAIAVIIGLLSVLAFNITMLLCVSIYLTIRFLLSRRFMKKIGRWLIAAD